MWFLCIYVFHLAAAVVGSLISSVKARLSVPDPLVGRSSNEC